MLRFVQQMCKFTSSVIRCRKGVARAARGVEEVDEEWGAHTEDRVDKYGDNGWDDSKEKKEKGHFLTYKWLLHFGCCEKQCGGRLRITTWRE